VAKKFLRRALECSCYVHNLHFIIVMCGKAMALMPGQPDLLFERPKPELIERTDDPVP
jgi:hypothetical protein